jgi:hypothetical protein
VSSPPKPGAVFYSPNHLQWIGMVRVSKKMRTERFEHWVDAVNFVFGKLYGS